MTDSIRRRFDPYDPVLLEGRRLAAQGIDYAEQEARADARREQQARDTIARLRAKADGLTMKDVHGRPMRGPATYTDRFGVTQWCDPMDEEKYL